MRRVRSASSSERNQDVKLRFVRKTGTSATVGDSPALWKVEGGRGGYIVQGDVLTAEEQAAAEQQEHYNPAERLTWIPGDVIQG